MKELSIIVFVFPSLTFCSSTGFAVTSQIYNQLGQYDYGRADCTGDLMQKTGTSKTGKKILYIGQFKTGTKIEDGIGISVWNSGDTFNY